MKIIIYVTDVMPIYIFVADVGVVQIRMQHVSTTLSLRTTRLDDALRHALHHAHTTLALHSLRCQHDQADHTATKQRLHCECATLIASPLRAYHDPTATVSRSDHAFAALATIM